MSASGRVCEITNGRFVEAKHEKRWLAVRLLRSKPAGRFGSSSACRSAQQQSFGRCKARGIGRVTGQERLANFGGANPRVAAYGQSCRSSAGPECPHPVSTSPRKTSGFGHSPNH